LATITEAEMIRYIVNLRRPGAKLRRRLVTAGVMWHLATALAGCRSPEDGRPRGGGAGGDGGNYRQKPVPVPSKLDASKPLDITSVMR
jgi:hypothetical protein